MRVLATRAAAPVAVPRLNQARLGRLRVASCAPACASHLDALHIMLAVTSSLVIKQLRPHKACPILRKACSCSASCNGVLSQVVSLVHL